MSRTLALFWDIGNLTSLPGDEGGKIVTFVPSYKKTHKLLIKRFVFFKKKLLHMIVESDSVLRSLFLPNQQINLNKSFGS